MNILYTPSCTAEPKSTQSRKNKKYKTLTRPVAKYGTGFWTLNKDIAKWLAAFGR
jgi:hypothetical protein